MISTAERDALAHALSLAAHGPTTGGNPQVGCVLLSPTGEVLAEGWHRGAGTAHAEVDALSKLPEGGARGATAVVTLEPCNHTGRTGPCAEALLAAGIARVVHAVADPGENSSGGAQRLRAAGVDVEQADAPEAEAFLAPWLTAERRHRPWVTLKWASTLDGRTAAADGTSQWITGTAARQRVHEQRADNDAILVGTGTVLADDPSLTARGDAGELLGRQPLPVVIGRREVPADAKLRRHPRQFRQFDGGDLDESLRELYDLGVKRVYVEGGPTLASALVAASLVDEYAVYLAPALLGGPRLALGDIGATSIGDARRLRLHSLEQLGSDLLITARPLIAGAGR
ncbi:bifunctional diaminohydroxyphosphoribosylaminopyrimidine deaminase/5-amino-6-(5-phosphoribosylamino)uracil reductase RibD [Desertivibrio insolitus]|uniref:bifunctional diaminohydroxyphosphoribosylaminopyrimidine deaminase/5-amino-6-(5-phosphoribosylamino)uracil reductase RibD n=1 Tax=Herbiconiux sp. SYSU D00978 TaxID=2812562 RepID=UPI001A962D1F|nr:bifunctional diaminohydroxyphosphoribosylaminopyrimidine deaminase/5-amino-6-(5-phosphoribosylamino)uracil reductase RibD [Herbiconiux sp. SYSU D00978]